MKYELYCQGCGMIIGYSYKQFEVGHIIQSSDIFYPFGVQAKTGDRVMHYPYPHLETIKQRLAK